MSAPLSEQQLAEIAARAEAATDGPWCTDDWEIYRGDEYVPGISEWIGETCRALDHEGARADAAFVAAARSDVPALLAEVERLQQERHETNEALDDAVTALRARDAEAQTAGLATEYRVPLADSAEWLWVRREPTGTRWAILSSHRVNGNRLAWVQGRWQSLPVVGPAGLWEYETAAAALDAATALAKGGAL